jgi:hypothetical protein
MEHACFMISSSTFALDVAQATRSQCTSKDVEAWHAARAVVRIVNFVCVCVCVCV